MNDSEFLAWFRKRAEVDPISRIWLEACEAQAEITVDEIIRQVCAESGLPASLIGTDGDDQRPPTPVRGE